MKSAKVLMMRMLASVALAGSILLAHPAKAADDLQEFAKTQQGRYAYGMYLAGKKVGWAVIESKVEDRLGKDVFAIDYDFRLSIKIYGSQTENRFQGRTVYSLAKDGPILSHDESESSDGEVIRREVRPSITGLEIVTVTADERTVRRTDRSRDTVRQMLALDRWLSKPPKRGETFDEYSLDVQAANGIDEKTVYSFLEQRELQWGGVPLKVSDVDAAMDDATIRMSVLRDGSILRGKMGPIDLRLEEEAVAKNFKAEVLDMLFQIPVDRELGEPEELSSLTLALDSSKFKIPQSHRQTMRTRDGRSVLELQRDAPQTTRVPLSSEEKDRYSQATPSIQSQHPKIKALAGKLTAGQKDPVEMARTLQHWVYTNLRPSYKDNASTAVRVLENGAGDCTEHALLFVALARSAGIPAREVGGLMYASEGKPFFGWHAWAEIHDGNNWVSVDPAWDEVYVDASHIKVTEGTDDLSWLSLIGDFQFEVVEVERSGN